MIRLIHQLQVYFLIKNREFDRNKRDKKDFNDKSTTLKCHNHQVTSSSTMSSVTKLPTIPEVTEKDQPIFPFVSSDIDNDDLCKEDSNSIINKPVIKGIGTSIRGGRMIVNVYM